ncbi:beta-lactamase/transpeptidase-like protein [Bimuria novae-zelandiae CBS 107.79]|uniref:Beta-lactamase/transpeptidase-like protein n=1 Tax=Bimuria novae-zelandiae CBS 107.79 TaxID=1447943 RepID=A0A6A5UHL1_9PLEO|nr:beta-lactamase/transpeptidase-like protein [Bimuria novae-zelandiae CBS 107.79]
MEARPTQLRPLIEELFDISGSSSSSLGVLHQGIPAHVAHFGRRQASRATPPDDDTLYNLASLTKLMTAGVVSNLVEEGLLGWDVPVRHYLPELGERRDAIGQYATLTDPLANRTGLSAQTTFWIPKLACHIPAIGEFRKTFVYSTWGYSLVTSTIERNVAYKHWVGLDGVTHEFPWSEYRGWSDETGFGGAAVASFTGYYGCMLLDPQYQSTIVVLVNSLPLVDITEIIGQLVLGTVLEENSWPDYIKLAQSVKNANMLDYEGDYWNDTKIMCYSVHVHGEKQLRISATGSYLTSYTLEPWGGDMFCLPPNRDLELSRSQWPFTSLKSRIFTFDCSDEKVLSFTWHHDITPGSKPETFWKANGSLHPRL